MSGGIHPPAWLMPWLTYQEAITERLKKATGEARLEVMCQKWDQADEWDKAYLQLSGSVWHREILMWTRMTCCWYARTIVPYSVYQLHENWFGRLKNETLTALLFKETTVKRQSMSYFPIEKNELDRRCDHWMVNEEWQGWSIFQCTAVRGLENTSPLTVPREVDLGHNGGQGQKSRLVPPLEAKYMNPSDSLLWARVSTFRFVTDHDFYLLEIFLPGLEGIKW